MRFVFLFLLLSSVTAFSQNTGEQDPDQPAAKPLPPPMINRDSLYREDQFYIGFSYNRLLNKPAGVSQNKFSSGFTGGFVRDMPFNAARTWAFATGLGVSYSKYFQNLVISKEDDIATYDLIATGTVYEKNKFEQFTIDIPLELRWRNSTPDSHKFWRIYSGVRVSYVVSARSKYVDPNYNITVTNNSDFNKLQVGAYLVWGYNTWNFYGYYGITPFFKSSATLNNRNVGLTPLHLGLMFYIL